MTPSAYALVWPDEAGYGGAPYELWVYDGTNLELSAQSDILQVDVARDTTSTNNFFFFKFAVRNQQNSQLTSVAHVAFIDTDGDGIFDYVLYNTTTGASISDLHYWDTNSIPNAWSDTPIPPAQTYSTYTRDSDNNDNYIELALPAADIGAPIVLLQGAASNQGALNLDGNTNNAPSLDDFADITELAVSEPTTDSSNILFTTVGTTNLTFQWAKGNGTGRIVVMATNAIAWLPTDKIDYTPSTTFTNGQEVTNGVRVVYGGSNTNISITGLATGTTYRVKIFEYNGMAGTKNYFTAGTPATANQQTQLPTLVVLTDFRVFSREGVTVIAWETAAELGSIGFFLERMDPTSGLFVSVNTVLLPALLGGLRLNSYEMDDPTATGETQTYRLIEIENTGKENVYGPFTVTLGEQGKSLMDWLSLYFTDPEWMTNAVEAAAADPDGDGLTNFEEFLASTNPDDAASLLQLLGARIESEGLVIEWQSASNMIYDIDLSTNGLAAFEAILTNVAATPPVNRAVIPAQTGALSGFYRIRTSR